MSDMLNEALALSGRGFRIIPIHTPGPRGCSCEKGPACGGSTGKHPRLNAWQREATTEPGKIRMWWRSWPDANIGLVMGGESRLVAVDMDGPEGRSTLSRLEDEHSILPATLTSRSGRVDGGEHRFFRVPDGLDIKAIKNRTGKSGGPMPKVDIRAEAGQVVAPPSLHASGNRYAWENRKVPIAELPRWLYDLATWEPAPPEVRATRIEPLVADRARAYLARIPVAVSGQGGHRQTLLAAEHLVRGFELDDGTAMSLLCEWNRGCYPPWSERELQHKLQEARHRGTAVSWGAHTRDDRQSEPAYQSRPLVIAKRITPGEGAELGMLGALLDAPALFDAPEVVECLTRIDGELALAVAAASADSAAVVIQSTPEPLRSFVSKRLDAPVYATVEEATPWFMHYWRAVIRARRSQAA